MKKTVILLIALIYAAGLMFVSFLGRNPKVFEPVIPVEKVEIINKEDDYHSAFGRYVVIEPDAKGRMQYQIEYKVYPSDATTSSISFNIGDTEENPINFASIDEKTGLLTFTGDGLVTVYVIADDGSTAMDKFTVIGVGLGPAPTPEE